MTDMRPITYSKAKKYTTRKVWYLDHHDNYIQVLSLRPSGPEIWIELADGRKFRWRKDTTFYVRRGR